MLAVVNYILSGAVVLQIGGTSPSRVMGRFGRLLRLKGIADGISSKGTKGMIAVVVSLVDK